MNNLKRILSLALASVMVIGMMVVGASAAEFVDGDDITHNAAVDTMTALGIIGGYAEDNSFRPDVKVTRAQMAKMIAVALNGGKDPVAGLTTASPFVDVAVNHWAIDYITYCANLGIISGKDPTHFDPEGFVKANEAAKMLLVAIGYDSDTFGFTGANWSANVIRMATTLLIGGTVKDGKLEGASSLNLFDGLEGVMAEAELTRDQSAQLIYNGIQANGVQMSLTGVVDGKPSYTYSLTGDSILVSKFKATILTGVLDTVSYTAATKNTPATWDYSITYTNESGKPAAQSYTTTLDVSDLFMQQIRVVSTGKDNDVLSITAAANDVASTGAFGGLKLTKDKAGEVTKLDGYQFAEENAADLTLYSLEDLKELTGKGDVVNYTGNIYDQYRLIDNNSDGEIDCVVVIPVTLTTVSKVTSKAVSLDGNGQATFEKDSIEDGLKKGDYVTVTVSKTGVKTVTAAETMTGKVDASRTTKGVTSLRVDGTWYTVGGEKLTAEKAAELNGSECDLVLVAGYIVAGKPVEAAVTLSDAVMVVTVAGKLGETGGTVDVAASKYLQIRVLKDDNTNDILNVIGFYDPEEENAEDRVTDISAQTDIKVGQAYTYMESPDAEGYYLLTPYEGDSFTEAMDNSKAITISKGIAQQGDETFRFDNDATVFVLAGTKYAALKGSDVNAWGATEYATAANDNGSALYATKSANGFTYVQVGFLTLKDETKVPGVGASTDAGYGIVTANAIRVYDSNNKQYCLSLTIWNGEEEIEVLDTKKSTAASDTATYPAGTVVAYTDNNNGTISGLTVLEDMDAVTAFDGNDTIKFAVAGKGGETDECKLTDDTVIVYVNLADAEGTTGILDLSILATMVDEDDKEKGYYANVFVAVDAKKNVEYLIVDMSNANDGNDKDGIVGAGKAPAHVHGSFVLDDTVTETDSTCTTKGQKPVYKCTAAGCDETSRRWLEESGTTVVEGGNDKKDLDSNNHTNMVWTEITADMATAGIGTAGEHIQYCDGCKTSTGTAHADGSSGNGCTVGTCSE